VLVFHVCSECLEVRDASSLSLCLQHFTHICALTEQLPCARGWGTVVKKTDIVPTFSEIMIKLSKQVFSPKSSV
jgi:hypothetical protein